MSEDPYARLRRALERDYGIETVLREEPAGAAYLAHELALNRRVLVRAIHPDLAGQAALEAFRREARLLAALSHPSLPAVHHAAPLEGFLHVVLEHAGTATVEARVREGPLAPAEVVRLGDQVLGALHAMHSAGFAHRAVRADHVIVAGSRYVLDGFRDAGAIATADDVAADLQGAARLLVLAAIPTGGSDRRLPAAVRRALRRGLDVDPAASWATAAEFRAALLEPPRRQLHPRRVAAAAAAVLVLGAGAWWLDIEPPVRPPPRELALVPFTVVGAPALDPLGADIRQLVRLNLEGLPGLRLTPPREIARWWERQGGVALGMNWSKAARELRAHWVVHGLVYRRLGDRLDIRLTLYDSLGARQSLQGVELPTADLAELGDSLTLRIIRRVAPRPDSVYEAVPGLDAVPLRALRAFLTGEAAFAQDAWAQAQSYYEVALRQDSMFGLAEWRIANVRRWRRLPFEGDLRTVYERHAARLRPRDRRLLEALVEPDLELRLLRLAEVARTDSLDGYARLLHGEELVHRGPLVGYGVDSSIAVFEAAGRQDPSLALAYDHLVLSAVRAGRRDAAREALAHRRAIGSPAHPDDIDLLPFLQLAYDERFRPLQAWARRQWIAWRGTPRMLAGIERVARTGTPWLDMPTTQLHYSELLLRKGPRSPPTHATAHEGIGLARYAMGQPAAALAEIDTAAALHDDLEAKLQQAEWRVVPAALGLPAVEGGPAEAALVDLVDDSVVGARAAWALTLVAQSAGDTAGALRWMERIAPDTPLRRLLEARQAAMSGRFGSALEISATVRQAFQITHPPDAFAGAVFHLLRGDWHSASGDRASADREWLWYEASDVEGWPTGLAQAGEVDAALGVFARLKRGRALLQAGTPADTLRACRHLRRVVELWADPDSLMQPLAREASALAVRCPE